MELLSYFGHGMVTLLETKVGNGHKTIPLGFRIPQHGLFYFYNKSYM